MVSSLEQMGLTFVCWHEWTGLGRAGGKSVNDLNCQGKESGLSLGGGGGRGALLFLLQMARPLANDHFILSPGSGVTLEGTFHEQ